jgi:hypothetical protein
MHFVQYRHPGRFARRLSAGDADDAKRGLGGDPQPSQCGEVALSAFEVATNKQVNWLIGQRLWVVCREGAPRGYYLCKSYLIAEVGEYGDDPISPLLGKLSSSCCETTSFAPDARLQCCIDL